MPYPFVPGEILTSANLNAALDMRMFSTMTGMGIIPGGVMFGHATNGGFQTDYQNLFYDNVNDRFGVGTNTPQAMLQVGKTAASLRSYNSWFDVANNAWTYLGDWTKFPGVATYGTEALGVGVVADVALIRGGTEYLRLNSIGLLASRGLSFGNVIAPLGATDTSRHITLWDAGYGFSITGGTLNYITGGQHHFIGTGTSIAQLMAGGTYINVPLIVQPTSTTAYPLEIIDLGTNAHSVLRIRNTPSGWGLAFDPFWPGVSFNSYHDGVNKKAFSNDYSGAFFLNPATGTLTFSSGNAPGAGLPVVETDRLSITATGFIGINHFTPAPAQNLAVRGVGGLGATVRSYRVLTSVTDGEWAYMGDWLGSIARYGTDKSGTGQARNIQFLVGGVVKLDYGTLGTAINAPDAWTIPTGALQFGTSVPVIQYNAGTSVGWGYNTYWTGAANVFGPGSVNQYAGSYDFDYTVGQHRWFVSTIAGDAGAANNLTVSMALRRGAGGPLLTLGDWCNAWDGTFPALRRNGTALEVRLSNDSAYAPLGTATITITALGSSVANSTNYGLNVTAITATSSVSGSITNYAIQVTVPTGGATVGSTNNTGLRITGTGGTAAGGTVTNYAVHCSSAANSFFLGPIIIGNTTSALGISVAGLTGHGLTLSAQNSGQSRLVIVRGGADTTPPQLFFAKGRGLNGVTSGIVLNNDILMEIRAAADDASIAAAFPITSAYHRAEVDGAVSTGVVPARFTWLTMGTAGGAAAERLRITANGMLTFGGATASFPALRPNGASLEARLANDSAYTQFRASAFYGDTILGAAESFAQAQWTMSAGSITWAGSRLSWAGRIVIIPVGTEAAGSGYFQFDQPVTPIPASQVYTGVARDVTGGVLLNAWEALYAECPVGGTYLSAIYRIVAYPISPGPPSNWILIATHNGDTGAIKLGTGGTLRAGDSVSAGGVTTQYIWNTATTPQSSASISILNGAVKNYFSYTDALNSDFAWMGEFAGGVAYYGTGKLGTGTARDVTIQRGGVSYLGLTSGAVTVPPQLRFTVGDTLAMTNIARTFYVRDQVSGVGTTAGSYVYPFEFVYAASNLERLQITGYRRAAGSTWNDAGWRIQTAVDSSFTTGTQTYLELTNVAGGGRVFLGVDGTDTLILSRTAYTEIIGVGQFSATGVTNGYQWADRGTGTLRSWYATGSASRLYCAGDIFWIYDTGRVAIGNAFAGGAGNLSVMSDARVYNTYTDSTNFEIGYMGLWVGNNLFYGSSQAGSGTPRNVYLQRGGVNVMAFDGGVVAFGTNANVAFTAAFPALRRSGDVLEIVNANQSDYSFINSKTAAPGNNTGLLATTAFIQEALNTRLALYLPLTGGSLSGQLTITAVPATGGQLRMTSGGTAYGSFFRNDGTNTYLLLTANNDPFGSWTTFRPFTVDNSTGRVSVANTLRITGATASVFNMFDDGNSHIESTTQLWLNGNTLVATTCGGPLISNSYISAGGASPAMVAGLIQAYMFTNTGASALVGNAYLDAASSWRYRVAGGATVMNNDGGNYTFFTAPSGAAGAVPSWTARFSIGNTGNLWTTSPYLYMSSGGGSVNTVGGPFVYMDASNNVFKIGSGNGANIFQDYNGVGRQVLSSTGTLEVYGSTTNTQITVIAPGAGDSRFKMYSSTNVYDWQMTVQGSSANFWIYNGKTGAVPLYITQSAQSIFQGPTYVAGSNSLHVAPGLGDASGVRLTPGATSGTAGYVSIYNSGGTRLCYFGYINDRPVLTVEAGGEFRIDGGHLAVNNGQVNSRGVNSLLTFDNRTDASYVFGWYADAYKARLWCSSGGDRVWYDIFTETLSTVGTFGAAAISVPGLIHTNTTMNACNYNLRSAAFALMDASATYTQIFDPGASNILMYASTGQNFYDNNQHWFRSRNGGSNLVEFTGAQTLNTNGVWIAFSDASLKEDVKPWTHRGLDAISKLVPVSFKYKRGTPFANAPDEEQTTILGLIAQDVEKVVPEIVGEHEGYVDGVKKMLLTMGSGQLVFVLINAVKELKERVEMLEAKLGEV